MTYCMDARLVRPGGLPTSNMLVGACSTRDAGCFLGRCAYTGVTFGLCSHVTPAYYQSLTPTGYIFSFLLSQLSFICCIFAKYLQIYNKSMITIEQLKEIQEREQALRRYL